MLQGFGFELHGLLRETTNPEQSSAGLAGALITGVVAGGVAIAIAGGVAIAMPGVAVIIIIIEEAAFGPTLGGVAATAPLPAAALVALLGSSARAGVSAAVAAAFGASGDSCDSCSCALASSSEPEQATTHTTPTIHE